MQNWLDDNDILTYSAHNKGKSVVAARFIRTYKGKIYKKGQLIIVNPIFGNLNKLLDKYDNSINHCINKKLINADCSALTSEIESIRKAPKFKAGNRFKIIKYKNIFSKGYTNNWSKKHLWLILCERLILGLTKLKI